MSRLIVIALLIAFSSASFAQGINERIDQILMGSPERAAETAFASGDSRYLLVPDCAEMLYGYPVSQDLTSRPLRKPDMRLAGPSCEDLLGRDLFARVLALRRYAEKYNERLHGLQASMGSSK